MIPRPRRFGVAIMLAVGVLLAGLTPVDAHTGELSSVTFHQEGCGPINQFECKTYRVKVTKPHGQSVFIPGDSNVFDLWAGVQEGSYPEICSYDWASLPMYCNSGQVTRVRVCIGLDGYGILACDDDETVAENESPQTVVVAWPATHANCTAFYRQTEAWGVNFHMDFLQDRFQCS